MKPPRQLAQRFSQLFIGLILYGIGIAFMLRSALGIAPWDVLAQGVSKHTGLSFGVMISLISVVVILFWIPLKQKPGIGTLLNGTIVGPIADIVLIYLPPTELIWLQIIYLASGIILIGVATGIYIGTHLGPGPRDGLMTGISSKFNQPIWLVRTLIEGTALLTGWLLGGMFGVGTVAFALTIGPICQFTLPLFDRGRRYAKKNPLPEASPEAA
ncbi:MAG: YitT family protein [Microbacteriaceae bacterium]